jgi:hypothetical protein
MARPSSRRTSTAHHGQRPWVPRGEDIEFDRLDAFSPISPRGGGRESNPPASSRPHAGFEGMSDAGGAFRPVTRVFVSSRRPRTRKALRGRSGSKTCPAAREDLSGHHFLDGHDTSDPSTQSWGGRTAMCTWSGIGGSGVVGSAGTMKAAGGSFAAVGGLTRPMRLRRPPTPNRGRSATTRPRLSCHPRRTRRTASTTCATPEGDG